MISPYPPGRYSDYDYWSLVFEGHEPHGRVLFICDSPGCKTTYRTNTRTLRGAIQIARENHWSVTKSNVWCLLHATEIEEEAELIQIQKIRGKSARPALQLMRRRRKYKFFIPLFHVRFQKTVSSHLRLTDIFRSDETEAFEIGEVAPGWALPEEEIDVPTLILGKKNHHPWNPRWHRR